MKTKHLLFGIVIIAVFFRFFQLSSVPPSPSLDEVSIGYNAYSILKTGADEFGNKFPILLRAYDDFRPALYVYLVIPFIKIFGLSVFAVRLPSVILSVLSVVATFFLAKQFFKKNSTNIGLSAALLTAISPWHIYISRLGHEANLAISFLIFGLTFFFEYLRNTKNSKLLYFSAFFFAVSFDSYQSTKIVVPLLLLALFIIYFKDLILKKKELILASVIGVVLCIPILIFSLSPNGLIRFKGTSLFASSPQLTEKSAKEVLEAKQKNDFIGEVIHNRRVYYSVLFSQAYLSHLNLVWLYFPTIDAQFKVPNFSLFYFFDFPLLIFGLFIFRKISNKKNLLFLIFWILIAIIPGAIANGYPHAMRIFNLLPAPLIIEGVALACIILYLKEKFGSFGKTIIILCLSLILITFSLSYFVFFPRDLSWQFQYGVVDALKEAEKIGVNYKSVIVSNQKNLSQSYMFYLFSQKYDPKIYQRNGGTKSGGYDANHQIGNFSFENIKDASYSGFLLLIDASEFKKREMKIIKNFTYLDGRDAMYLVKEKNLDPATKAPSL